MRGGGSNTHSGLGTANDILRAMEPIIYKDFTPKQIDKAIDDTKECLASKYELMRTPVRELEGKYRNYCPNTDAPCKKCGGCRNA